MSQMRVLVILCVSLASLGVDALWFHQGMERLRFTQPLSLSIGAHSTLPPVGVEPGEG